MKSFHPDELHVSRGARGIRYYATHGECGFAPGEFPPCFEIAGEPNPFFMCGVVHAGGRIESVAYSARGSFSRAVIRNA